MYWRLIIQIEKAKDQNSFWNMWKKFNSTKNKDGIKIKDGNVWKTYFSNVYLNPENNGLNKQQMSIIDKIKSLENAIKDNQNALDGLITIGKLQEKLADLKNEKGLWHR